MSQEIKTIEEQIRELKAKATRYDEVKAIIEKKVIALEKIEKGMNEVVKELVQLFVIRTSETRSDYTPQITALYQSLVRGDRSDIYVEDVIKATGLESSNAGYWFNKISSMDGVEKVRDGQRVKLIFHLNRMGTHIGGN